MPSKYQWAHPSLYAFSAIGRHNRGVRAQRRSIGVVWALAVTGAVLCGVFARPDDRFVWLGLTLVACTLLTLSLQIAIGQKVGYVRRTTASITGSVLVLFAATAIFAVLGLFA